MPSQNDLSIAQFQHATAWKVQELASSVQDLAVKMENPYIRGRMRDSKLARKADTREKDPMPIN
ncbi:hypothetical protein PAAG_11642 [Paracoccidioides lutzii Pb01]|uniref:Uncharacterized protein n=1 Tax=Paracoccidioides lutzii (strain ATCC MYA-826 / Pb01) TaxID=502779 RepID=A0A0A2V1J9_PARBA|nr:hypothetical protein PAAG_11642 [Paracoccidioides lutzii Pb01]KGQ01651.1 hypothetical protein PAAG_11642 [Paracoccidioides lutzii Pb01]